MVFPVVLGSGRRLFADNGATSSMKLVQCKPAAECAILVYQALSNEAEIWRRIDFAQLDNQQPVFQSDMSILRPLAPFNAAVKIDTPRADIKNVTFTVRWNKGQRQARLAILRADTGGSGLW